MACGVARRRGAGRSSLVAGGWWLVHVHVGSEARPCAWEHGRPWRGGALTQKYDMPDFILAYLKLVSVFLKLASCTTQGPGKGGGGARFRMSRAR